KLDVEHMYLVVARDDPARRVNQIGTIAKLLLHRHAHLDRTEQEPGASFARRCPTGRQHGVALFSLRLGQGVSAVGANETGVLRRHDKIGAGIAGKSCLFTHKRYVFGRLVADIGLDQAGLEHSHGGCPGWASSASSLPSRSRSESSSDPPICWPLMKICGTVERLER